MPDCGGAAGFVAVCPTTVLFLELDEFLFATEAIPFFTVVIVAPFARVLSLSYAMDAVCAAICFAFSACSSGVGGLVSGRVSRPTIGFAPGRFYCSAFLTAASCFALSFRSLSAKFYGLVLH